MEIRKPQINKVKNRILFLSPTVKAGLERECNRDDFLSEGDRPVGNGGFGKVFKVTHKVTKKVYAIKVMDKESIIKHKMQDQINREIEIMYKINHPHIVKLVNHYEDDDNLYLIMNFAAKGQLYLLLKKASKFDQRTVAQYMREIISAIKYLHSFNPPIIHRDIKPENILVDENNRMKVCDFGWSNYEASSQRTTYCGTPEYLAPEIIKKEGHDTNVDIWDIGVLLFELLTGYSPFSAATQNELFNNIKKQKINWPNDFPSLAQNLLTKILKQIPKERISIDNILAHTWFENNPPFRPVLVKTETDSKKILESYLINVQVEKVQDKINSIIRVRPSRVVKETQINIINTENNSESTSGTSENQIGSSLYGSKILDLSKKIEEAKQELSESHKREILEMRNTNEKLEADIKSYKNELLKFSSLRQNMEKENLKLKEEVDKYKILNKDRLDNLTEIEEKNNLIIELKNKQRYSENEVDTLKRNVKSYEEKYVNSIKQFEFSENKVRDLKQEIENLHKEKDHTISQYLQKLKVMEAKFFESSKNEDNGPNLETVVLMVKDSLEELKSYFKTKIESLSKMMLEMKDESSATERKFSIVIDDKINSIKEIINQMKTSVCSDVGKSRTKNDKEAGIIIWLKGQVSELIPFRTKYGNLENDYNKLKSSIKITEEHYQIQKQLLDLVENLSNEKDIKINEKNEYIGSLEAKLSDVKHFVHLNCSEKLDDFNKSYQF